MSVQDNAGIRNEIAASYIRTGALLSGSLALTGGGHTDLYIDGRLVTTNITALNLVADAMAALIIERQLLGPQDSLVAPVLSGVGIAVAVALELGVDYVMDRGGMKDHGSGRRFEGRFRDGERCLIVDDLVTIGSTISSTTEGLRSLGKAVTDAVVIVDRQEGGREALCAIGLKLHSLVTKADLIEALSRVTADA
jgi:orotate phosphoribosyltransferase